MLVYTYLSTENNYPTEKMTKKIFDKFVKEKQNFCLKANEFKVKFFHPSEEYVYYTSRDNRYDLATALEQKQIKLFELFGESEIICDVADDEDFDFYGNNDCCYLNISYFYDKINITFSLKPIFPIKHKSEKKNIDKETKKNKMCYICQIDFIDCDEKQVINNSCCNSNACIECYKMLMYKQKVKCSCCRSEIIFYKCDGNKTFLNLIDEINLYLNRDISDVSLEELEVLRDKIYDGYKASNEEESIILFDIDFKVRDLYTTKKKQLGYTW